MNDELISLPNGIRGPHEHSVRDQIVQAAGDYFSHYGYGKTTVSDLAKAIGISKAYIYKFFDSKQAIGEAICGDTLKAIRDTVLASVAGGRTATDKLRRFASSMTAASIELFFSDRKLYDIAAFSASEKWQSWSEHRERIEALLLDILREGRESGEFERKTPVDELGRAIILVMQPFVNPLFLQHNLDTATDSQREIIGLVLRSLAP
jgi:AcrR family transcriptional regulator